MDRSLIGGLMILIPLYIMLNFVMWECEGWKGVVFGNMLVWWLGAAFVLIGG